MNFTEEPSVGSQVTDREGDVWERREEGWALWWPKRSGWVADLYEGELDPWPVVRNQAPLRFTTDEDRKRVGLPAEPAEITEEPPVRRVNVTITDVYAAPDDYGFLRINVGPETAVIDPNASNVTVTDVESAPTEGDRP